VNQADGGRSTPLTGLLGQALTSLKAAIIYRNDEPAA
jgi:hypothetical protein